jgi:dopachrome tautomerase
VGSRGKDSQSTMHSLHHDSMFFAEINKNAVGCWNTKKPLRPSNVHEVLRDDIKLVYPSDLVVRIKKFFLFFHELTSQFLGLWR